MSGLGLFRLHQPGMRASSSSSEDESQHRSPPGPNPNRVKRALFGPTDHEENLRFVRKELKKAKNEAASKWNFDFDSGIPLEGRFSWEQAAVGEVPMPYLAALPTLSDAEASESKENRVSPSPSLSPTTTSVATLVTETPLTSTSQPPDPLAEPAGGSIHDLRTPAPPPTSASSTATPSTSSSSREKPPEPSTSSSSEQLGARKKESTKERKITDAQYQFKARKSRSKSSSKLRLKRLGGGADAASRSPSVKGVRGPPRDSEEAALAPLARPPLPPPAGPNEGASSSDE